MIFINPRERELPEDAEELYQKIIPSKNGLQIKKVPFEELDTRSYIYDNTPAEKLDNFIADENIKIYGYHSSNYTLCFKPSIGEVIRFAEDLIRNAEKVQIDTQACDKNGNVTDNAKDTYIEDLGLHMGVTILGIKKKN